MAVIRQDFNVMYLPAAIQRNNPIPLDSTAVWYDYGLMAAYAANDPTAYVGQILSLVVDNVANAYIITNLAGDLEKVGSAVVADNKTIVLDNGAVAFKDFGKRYYKYDAETETYALQEVDENHPWIAGLEPKVASENGQLVLGWYEPNATTMEGVNSTLGTLQTTVTDLQGAVSDLSDEVQNTKSILENVYTKGEVDDAIIAAVADASGLTYKKVSSINEIDLSEDKVIYLVPALEGLAHDVYDEYMVIDGAVEKVGSWEVNLDDYATKEALENKVDKVDGARLITESEAYILNSIEENAQKNYINEVSSDFTVKDGKLEIISVPSTIDLSKTQAYKDLIAGMDNLVVKEEGKSLIDNILISKLDGIEPGAEVNYIRSVNSELSVDTLGALSIVSVDGSKITNLSSNTDFSALVAQVQTNVTDISNLVASVEAIDTNLTLLRVDLGNVEGAVNQHERAIEDILNILTWQDLEEPVI